MATVNVNVHNDAGSHYYSGQGVLMIGARGTDGQPTGLRPVGNVSSLKIMISNSVTDHKGAQDGQRAIDKRLVTETKPTVSFDIENLNSANLAMGLRGTATDVAGATVTAGPYNGYVGMVTPLGFVNVSAVSVTSAEVSPLTLVEYVNDATPWDWRVNMDAGSIMLNDGVSFGVANSGLTTLLPGAKTLLHVTFTYPAQKYVSALNTAPKEMYLRFEGLNTTENDANGDFSPVVVEVWKFSVDPLKELDLINDAFAKITVEGAILADPTKATGSKFFRATQLN